MNFTLLLSLNSNVFIIRWIRWTKWNFLKNFYRHPAGINRGNMVTDNAEPVDDGVVVPAVEAPAPADSPKVFSQEDVNRMVGQRVKEVRGQYVDYDQLKERAAKADELEQAQLSETERLSQKAVEAERSASEANAKMTDALISSEVRVRAVQLGVVDPDAAYLLMDKSGVQYNADRGVTGVDEALTQLLEDKPYLKGVAVRSPNINPETGQVAPVTRLTADQQEAARLMGMSEEDYAQGL
jgi:phage I-like protein